uniref:Uncharacterized protein n=1 Tax=Chromera velia CCMP2878 TaxID=1169474 RepID=A0A0G4HJ98_9ALVE|eukprot:Cvel_7105.t1-p1 / transcript=Cvel_7105.t1 / gene=Cvel_7105 / organism=Chromera_velia_CCMP2878 / gene_product=hypothetical protein / transcript_product=hypothetical protein / location=Cvel_scaffold364:13602-16310(+) / protein_length=91 / sequence_SO=supercontig / SO=protein_coding / is_pseudo=false
MVGSTMWWDQDQYAASLVPGGEGEIKKAVKLTDKDLLVSVDEEIDMSLQEQHQEKVGKLALQKPASSAILDIASLCGARKLFGKLVKKELW